YGTTQRILNTGGSVRSHGIVFKITTDGTFTILHRFSGGDGSDPVRMVQASDGNFYGTTFSGGFLDAGTIFKMTPSGTLTTLYAFSGAEDGSGPFALVQAGDGDLYGTTYQDADVTRGTMFKITTAGALTTLHTFTNAPADGAQPTLLLQGSDGDFYGITQH